LASFDGHILQAKNNLVFLLAVNRVNNKNWDWQVTIAYYIGVHIVNAHIIGTTNMHYRAHHEVKNSLFNDPSIPEDIYLAYARLEGLSRRARYLISENTNDHSQSDFFTYDVHFAKSIKNLDKIIHHFTPLCHLTPGNPEVKCPCLNSKTPLSVFKVET
jgi:hypothetical protein